MPTTLRRATFSQCAAAAPRLRSSFAPSCTQTSRMHALCDLPSRTTGRVPRATCSGTRRCRLDAFMPAGYRLLADVRGWLASVEAHCPAAREGRTPTRSAPRRMARAPQQVVGPRVDRWGAGGARAVRLWHVASVGKRERMVGSCVCVRWVGGWVGMCTHRLTAPCPRVLAMRRSRRAARPALGAYQRQTMTVCGDAATGSLVDPRGTSMSPRVR